MKSRLRTLAAEVRDKLATIDKRATRDAKLAVQISMRGLPRKAQPVFEEMQAKVQKGRDVALAMENGLQRKLTAIRKLEHVKRDLARAREGFKQVGGFAPAVGQALDDLYAIADERLKTYAAIKKQLVVEYLWPLGRMNGRRGAPRLPSEIVVYGADAVNALIGMGVSESEAARRVVRCLNPYSLRTLNGPQFLRYLRDLKLIPRKQK